MFRKIDLFSLHRDSNSQPKWLGSLEQNSTINYEKISYFRLFNLHIKLHHWKV